MTISGASSPVTPSGSVADVIRSRAGRAPAQPALVCEGRTLSFGALDARANRVANRLLDTTSPGDRIALLDTNSEVFYELFFGVARADRILVPVNFRLADPEIAYILEDAAISTLVVGGDFAGRVAAIAVHCTRRFHVVAIGGACGLPSYEEWLSDDASDPCADAPSTAPVLVMYTSGTTGHPKGAMLSHENLLVVPPVLLREYGSAAHDVALVCLPLFHVSGSLWGVAALFAGMTTVILRSMAPADILQAIAAHRVTKTFLVPALMQWLVDAGPGYDCSSLDLIVYGASPISPGLLRTTLTTFRCRLAQVYGLTETAGGLTYLPPEDHVGSDAGVLESCGRPLDGVELRVVDAAGEDVPRGSIGEIVVRSRQIMGGYWRQEAATAAAFLGDWFRTGDAGCLDHAGYVYVRDRIKDMVITGGENVYPAEVELVIGHHPDVAEVAVIGVPDGHWGEAVCGVVVPRAGAHPSAEAIIAFARDRMAHYKAPTSIHFLERLPRNAAGKVLKRELRTRFGVPSQ